MKRTILLLGLLLTTAAAAAQPRIRVEHGSIQVVSADCPDQVCVRQGAISGGYVPIACVPHGLVIDILNPEDEA